VRILAIDTATESCSVALLLGTQLLQRARRIERGHAEVILPMVDEVLLEAGLSLAVLTAIAFGRGPGAFTGVRLAASVAQGLAFGAGLPVVPVSDLQAVAQRALDDDRTIGRVLACADARMQEVYWGCFERSAEGLARPSDVERVARPERVRPPAAWGHRRPGGSGGAPSAPQPGAAAWRLAGVGSGFAAYPKLGTELCLDVVLAGLLPRAAEIAHLAVPEAAAGRFLPPEQALPVYLRDDVVRAPARPSSN
jgi:tRNA threonylcarbamoyladenosine biosynthesis protein TsaB